MNNQAKRLERALRGAYKLGDKQVDELVRLSGITVRQRRAMWRAFCLLRQGRYDDAVAILEAECSLSTIDNVPEPRDRKIDPESPQETDELEAWWRRRRDLDDPGGAT